MAEIIAVVGAISTVISIGNSIMSAISGLAKTGQVISEIKNAPLEAKHIATQLDTARSILTSMRSSLDTLDRSQNFLRVWGASAQQVLSNIETTMAQIQKKLCKRGFLGIKSRFRWRYEKVEAQALQQTLQGYMQMLGLVQNGLLQENLQVLQTSAHKIENIISKSGDLNLPAEKSLGDTSKVKVLTCSDEVVEPSYDDLISPIDSPALPSRNNMKELVTWTADDFHFGFLKGTSGLAEEKRGGSNRELRRELGPGKITLALNENRTYLWIIYRPKKRGAGESRWYRQLDTHFKLEGTSDYDYDARRIVANGWDFFHSSEDYKSSNPGVSFKGVSLFISGLQADAKSNTQTIVPGEWVEISLQSQSRISKHLKSLGKDVEVATKRKAAAESAARMSIIDLTKKKKKIK